jgi:hypothetical protein
VASAPTTARVVPPDRAADFLGFFENFDERRGQMTRVERLDAGRRETRFGK